MMLRVGPCITCGRSGDDKSIAEECERLGHPHRWITEDECYPCWLKELDAIKAAQRKRRDARKSAIAKLGVILTEEEVEALFPE